MMKIAENRAKTGILCQNRHYAYQNSNYNLKPDTSEIAPAACCEAH